MVLFPYKADVDLGRVPVMTLLVCAICVWVFANQALSAHEYRTALDQYCNHELTRDEELVLRYLDGPANQHYCEVMLKIRSAPDAAAVIRQLADTSRPTPFYRNPIDSSNYVYNTLSEGARRFERSIPHDLTDQLMYEPGQLNVWRMVTAAFSHADWLHLISNLIFFFAFAASVETITGYLYFFGFIVSSAVGTHLAYSYSVMGVADAPPTVGLSGVVMAMTAFLATVSPRLRIKCFFWLVVIVRTFSVPALLIAAFYIVQDVFFLLRREEGSSVNYVAHVGGAAIGVLAGMVYRYTHRELLRAVTDGI